jgi:TolB protein
MERIESPSRPSSSHCRRRSAPLAVGAGLALSALLTLWAVDARPQQPSPPPDDVYRIIIGGARQRFALPACVPKRSDEATLAACRTVNDILRKDLDFEAVFQFVPDALLKAVPPLNPEAPRFDDCKAIDAQILVTTQAEISGSTLSVSLRVFFVETGRAILVRQYSGKADNPRIFAHQAADDILAQVQYRGVARTRIVFASDRDATKGHPAKELYIADYDGFGVRRMTVTQSINILPTWAPDGKGIAYVSYRQNIPGLFLAWIVQARNQLLTGGPGTRGQTDSPAFSPDGKRLAFASSRTGNTEIWIANSDGSGARQITHGSGIDTAPCWSPTGQEIAFTSDRTGSPQIWVMDTEGLNVRRVTSIGNYNDGAVWNPSKEFPEIAYTARLDGGRFQIAVVDLATREVRQITEGLGSCESASWAPSGRHLIYSCSRNRTSQIVRSDRVGRRPLVLALGPGNNTQPDWGPFPAE